MPLPSCWLGAETLIASGKPYLSRWILMPLIFLPPSKPRPKQFAAERQDRLSTMTALGSGVSPQACRQVWIKRLSRRRHTGPPGKQRVQRAERNVAQLADRAPLHAAEAHAPDRHVAQRRSDQRRLRPG